MKFRINVPLNFKNRWYNIERLSADGFNEVFRITGKNKSVVVKNNRPFVRELGLKHKRIDWEVVEGEVWFPSQLEPFYKQILAYLEP